MKQRNVWSANHYEAVILAWELNQNYYLVASHYGMPKKTVDDIIYRFKKTGQRFPRKRGGHELKFNKKELSVWLCTFLSYPTNSNSTLQEIRQQMWEDRAKLKLSHLPSTSYIHNLLHTKLFSSKKFTLKQATLSPVIRNSATVVLERKKFVEWIEKQDKDQIVWIDEHGFNFWTVRHKARSIQGTPAVIQVPTVKGKNMSVVLAVSSTFGKIHMQSLSGSLTANRFSTFLDFLLKAWNENPKIPESVKEKGPIILLDNLAAHNCPNLQNFNHYWLPKYSPFLNISERANRHHKKNIRKLWHNKVYDKNVKWGEKGNKRIEYLCQVAHVAWLKIPDESMMEYFEFVKTKYFHQCLSLQPIDC